MVEKINKVNKILVSRKATDSIPVKTAELNAVIDKVNEVVSELEVLASNISIKSLYLRKNDEDIAIAGANGDGYGKTQIATFKIPANTITDSGWLTLDGRFLAYTVSTDQTIVLKLGIVSGTSWDVVTAQTKDAYENSANGIFHGTVVGEVAIEAVMTSGTITGGQGTIYGIDWTQEQTIEVFAENQGAAAATCRVYFLQIIAYKAE